MPAESPRQQRAAGADVARCEKGEKPRTFDSCAVAREFARKPAGGYTTGMERSAHGSGAFTEAEVAQGYRRVPIRG